MHKGNDIDEALWSARGKGLFGERNHWAIKFRYSMCVLHGIGDYLSIERRIWAVDFTVLLPLFILTSS